MTTTLQRDSRAEFRLKEGFSVVAPIRVIVPIRELSTEKKTGWVTKVLTAEQSLMVYLFPRKAGRNLAGAC